jgi:hypothetical protein
MRKIRVRVETNFASRFNPVTPVQSSRKKYSALCSPQISRIIPRIPPRAEGRIAIVTNVEAGSGGRETSQHASMIRSRRPRSAKRGAVFLPTSASRLRRDRAQSKSMRTNDCRADGQAVWSRHPDAGVKLATTCSRRAGDGGKKARFTEESAE